MNGRDEPDGSGKVMLPARYEVGYGKPPTEHRFKKGRSGNPRGRPKGKAASGAKTPVEVKQAESFLRQEAYRPVAIREGERVIELPAIQAVFRAMGLSALKGSCLSADSCCPCPVDISFATARPSAVSPESAQSQSVCQVAVS